MDARQALQVYARRGAARLALALALLPAVLQAQEPLARRWTDAWEDPALSDTARLHTLNDLLWDALNVDPDTVVRLAAPLRRLALERAQPRWAAETDHVCGLGLLYTGRAREGLVHMDSALAGYRRLNDARGRMRVHANTSLLLIEQGDIASAIRHYTAALELAGELGDQRTVASVLANIGELYDRLGDMENARTFYQRGLDLCMQEGLHDGEGYIHASLARLHILGGDIPAALPHLARAKALSDPRADHSLRAMVMLTEAELSLAQGDASAALARFQEAKAWAERHDLVFTQVDMELGVARCLLALGRPREALRHATAGHALAMRTRQQRARMEAAGMLYRCQRDLGNAHSALVHLEEHALLKDSLAAERNRNAIAGLHQRYDSEREEAARRERQVAIDLRQRIIRNSIAAGLAASLLVLLLVLRQRARLARERARSEGLLRNILPAEVAEELKDTGSAQARHFDRATILFTDFKGFTQLSEQVTPAGLVEELNTCFKAFDGIMVKHRIEKIKTIGDAYMAAGGLPDPAHGSPADVVRAALEMQDFMVKHKAEREAQGRPFFEMRVGIHTGPVVAGIVGTTKFQYDIWGDTVNTASRMESSGEVGQVNISEATYELVRNEPGLTFNPRGKVQAKGKGEMAMYFVSRSAESA